jgi:hypothetical protein
VLLVVSVGTTFHTDSSYQANAFTFWFEMCFRYKDTLGGRGISKKSKVFTRQAHVVMPGKAP